MDRSTRFTLIATVLLGILLYYLLIFEDDLLQESAKDFVREAPSELAATPSPAPAQSEPMPPPDPGLPRIDSHAALIRFLDDRGLNGRLMVDQAADWYAARGYLGANELLGITPDEARNTYYDTLDDATLKSLSDAGDAAATQTLARVAMFLDPFEALSLYEKATSQGSVYAVIKVADTLSILADGWLAGAAVNPDFVRRLGELRNDVPNKNMHTEAYATMLSVIGDGGAPVVDTELLNWATWLEERTPQRSLEYACKRSADILVANGAARRANGVDPVSMTPPPVFLSPPDSDARMPCAATGYPIVSLMNVDECATEPIIDHTGKEAVLRICQP